MAAEDPSADERRRAARRRPAAELRSADECQPAAEDLARAFGFLGKRWTAIILGHLSHGPAGFATCRAGSAGSATPSCPSGSPTWPAAA